MKRIELKMVGQPESDAAVRAPAPWLAMGFRPFFGAAALFVVFATGAWLHVLATGGGSTYLPGSLWHAHEMVFGFCLAVVAGFLLTAARNWTGLDTLHGWPLLALFALWGAGRIALVVSVPPALNAALGIAFPLGLLAVVGRVIVKASSRRNYGIVVLLSVLTAAATAVHLDALGVAPGLARPALIGAVHLIVTLIVVIGGRIIPLFTRNKTGVQTRSVPTHDALAIGSAVLVCGLATAATAVASEALNAALATVAIASGLVQLTRMRTWGTRSAMGTPMLAVLHVAYAWIGIGHLLLGLVVWSGAASQTVALHALTIGAIGTMILGMMARVSMGHTGREIRASWPLSIAFVALSIAALVRLLGAVVPPAELPTTWLVSGALFAAAFGTYLAVGWRWLLGPRPDGKLG